MKKFLIYLISFILIFFIIPALLTRRTISTSVQNEWKTEENSQKNVENSNESKTENSIENINLENDYNYNKYGTINLLHKKTGKVEQVKLDDYLCNVVSAEMPANFELEALKAQAIVARTYTIYKVINKKHENADICDDSNCCQAWISKEDRLAKWSENERENNWDKICKAVKETQGKIIVYDNKPIDAFFHSNSGGTTEVPVNVWGGSNFPYLQSVQTSGEEGYAQYSSEVNLKNDELLEKLKTKYPDILIDFSKDDEIKILEYTESKRVKTVKFGNHELSGVETRKLLGLKSTNFEIQREGDNIKFKVVGYGHGVGMSQTGADSMAKNGNSAEEIIKHFYTGVEVKYMNEITI